MYLIDRKVEAGGVSKAVAEILSGDVGSVLVLFGENGVVEGGIQG